MNKAQRAEVRRVAPRRVQVRAADCIDPSAQTLAYMDWARAKGLRNVTVYPRDTGRWAKFCTDIVARNIAAYSNDMQYTFLPDDD